jgi:hypothetical protein
VVLATQNPVDIDYKGLSNAGTWFIGRLQTERDKLRVLDGLAGASAQAGVGFDSEKMSDLLSSLSSRVFLMNNVHDSEPVVFETRWVMSYLRGPLTRNQLKALTRNSVSNGLPPGGEAGAPQASKQMTAVVDEDEPANTTAATRSPRPVLSPKIRQSFIPIRSHAADDATLLYRPGLLGFADVYFQDARTGVDETRHYTFNPARGADGQIDWSAATLVDLSLADLDNDPQEGAAYARVPDYAANPRHYDAWARQLSDAILRGQRVELFKSARYGLISRPGESERDFRLRLAVAAREQRDADVDKLRRKYAPKLATMQERLRRAQQAVDREKSQARTSSLQTVISFGATILGAFLGRKKISAGSVGRATTTARGVGRSRKEQQDVARAEETVEAVQARQAELDAQFQEEMNAMEAAFDPVSEPLESVAVRPKKSNVTIDGIVLVWMPYWQGADGRPVSAWE